MRISQRHPALPQLPEPIRFLKDLTFDLRLGWRPEIERLFAVLDSDAWRGAKKNAVRFLRSLPPEVLEAAAADQRYLSALAEVRAALDTEDSSSPALAAAAELCERGESVAYFCAEFGLSECLPIYAGGLGVLAGDTLKSASDLGLPVVGVGLFYREGYFRQTIASDGSQQELNPPTDPETLPLSIALQDDGSPAKVSVALPGRNVFALVRLAKVGRIPLLLLDSDLEDNFPADRAITRRLYGGDRETRLQQEILLGIGGMRALELLGCRPAVRHLNEGHAAFATLEQIRQLMDARRIGFEEARELGSAGNVFTTHTPVPAGIDLFPHELMEKYFTTFSDQLGIPFTDLFLLGREVATPERNLFSMAVLALTLSEKVNAVSRLHGRVSRELWHSMDIDSITNGVHRPTWTDPEIRRRAGPTNGPGELWRKHEELRFRLIERCREILGRPVLDPRALTIGFARRFATYKRAPLVFADPERLQRILRAPGRNVQLIFSGKAHPQDEPGKQFLRRIVEISEEAPFQDSVVFLPDYDIELARLLVSGCDVWLNNPERPLEASGTSGMKAAMNGVLNLSVLDGWWDEAPREETGFSFGPAQDHPPAEVMSAALYDALEREVVPLFYERGVDGVPAGWLRKMSSSIDLIGALFSSDRMMREYLERCYLPATRKANRSRDTRLDVSEPIARES